MESGKEYNASDFREVLWYMRRKFGREIFRNPKRMFALLRDLAPGLEAESNVLRQLAERGLLADLEKVSPSDRDTRHVMKLYACLTDYLQLSEERAAYYVTLLLELYELPYAPSYCLPVGRTGRLAWTLDESGLMSVFGSGPMDNYSFSSGAVNSPWWERRTEITSVVISDGVTAVGDSAFYGCENLKTVTLSNSVLRIGEWAFADCARLDRITLPEKLRRIDRGAFSDCKALPEIKIPDGIHMLESWTFCNCTRLHRVTIPDSISGIGQRAFQGCALLSHVQVPAAAWVEETAFDSTVALTRHLPQNIAPPEETPPPRWKPILLPSWLNAAAAQKFLLASFLLAVILRHGVLTLPLIGLPVALLLFLERP
ncbi:MAG: leucine-rich repeat domain-containing protein [Oscillibacter sp.]|nr:leucine-rich repeat domain-containing protein [Oscillibacter sp.]